MGCFHDIFFCFYLVLVHMICFSLSLLLLNNKVNRCYISLRSLEVLIGLALKMKKKIMQLQMWVVWMVPLSLLDNAPNYLAGCVIQKRSTRFWLYYLLLSPLRPRRLIVMEWIKGGHGGNWIYCWSDDTKRCKWSWNSVVGKSWNWFGLFWCGWNFFSICCCFCSGGSTDDIWGNFAGWCIILK